MSSPPPSKRQKPSPATTTIPTTTTEDPVVTLPTVPIPPPPPPPPPLAQPLPPKTTVLDTLPPPPPESATNPLNARKRRATRSPKLDTLPPGTSLPFEPSAGTSASVSIPALLTEDSGKKRGRTNTPWTATEEQRLKQMRDAGNSWGEIAKAFPNRTEGSVKKHWYKDMHYAEFAEDESVALREAIKEYEANKWKAIGQKLGKPAKACEQYAREHFRNI